MELLEPRLQGGLRELRLLRVRSSGGSGGYRFTTVILQSWQCAGKSVAREGRRVGMSLSR